LVLCRSEEEARSARPDLGHLLTPAAMLMKHCQDTVRDLTLGQHAEWLGYQVAHEGRLIVTIAESAWDGLREKLALDHSKPQSPLRAYSTIRGWVVQQGPCYPYANRNQAYARLVKIAGELAFDEIPNRNQVRGRWRRAHARWCRLGKGVAGEGAVRAPQKSGGSASHVVFSTRVGRGDGVSAEAPSPPFPTHERLALYTDGSCLRNRVGGWAYLVEAADGSRIAERCGALRRTTNNRAELLAVIKGLESLPSSAAVRLVTDSQYVAAGINERMPIWKAQGWRCGSHKHLRSLENADLWHRLDSALVKHRVICEHVRGHAGQRQNEECDRMAREAAERLCRRA